MTHTALKTHGTCKVCSPLRDLLCKAQRGAFSDMCGSTTIRLLVSSRWVCCAHFAAMVWVGCRFRQCRSTFFVSILESGSGVGADMHAALGHGRTSQSCALCCTHGTLWARGRWALQYDSLHESCASLLVGASQPLRGAEPEYSGTVFDFRMRSLRLYLPQIPDWEGEMHLEKGRNVHIPSIPPKYPRIHFP